MLYCNLQVLLCTEIAVQEFAPPLLKYDSGGTSGGAGAKKNSRLAIARHILRPPHKLRCNSTIASDPQAGWERCPLPFLIPLDAFGILILGALGASSSEQSYAPGWVPDLPPAKSGLLALDGKSC